MSTTSDISQANVERRRFIRVAGTILGVSGISALALTGSAQAAEKVPAKVLESLSEYANKLSKDKKAMSATRNQLERLLRGLRNGEDLEKLCQTMTDSTPELKRAVKLYPVGSGGPAGFPLFVLFVLIVMVIMIADA